ncbi:restriction endonuclease subunit S [Paenibacillus lautus]|uniref:restriction endonuclease subunit S n=1 Tax=Paenibacillus lautus TaxID=1401 RepID=UPI001C7CD722|nr:restriction endonuclease subunit S [Paenibacillus lautus]MBX4150738.1 restriction endonuclease subunit S [Paenibacillus lautus]
MSRVLLGDVAKERRETFKSSKDGYPIVGLEHLTPEEIILTAWDEGKENTFSKLFREGDILFGRRRAYLKKAAVAPFDGICSGDITVIESIPERILPELFPFIIQNDALFEYAVRKSAGSLSPRVKWENLKNYEFELPDIDKQRELAKILWAIDTTKKTYRKLLQKTDELVKSQFIEMFGDPVTNPMGWEVNRLEDITVFLTSGSRGWSGYFADDGEMFITIKNVKNGSILTDNMQYIHAPETKEAERTRVKEDDLLISVTADLGRTGVVNAEIANYGAYINQHLSLVRLDKTRINPHFVSHYLETDAGKNQFESKNQVGVKAGLNFNAINSLTVFIPPLELQNQYISFVRHTDKSKFELEQALKELDSTYKKIISENLS